MRSLKVKLLQMAVGILLFGGYAPGVSAQEPATMSPANVIREAEQENWFIRASTREREVVGRIGEIRRDTAVIGEHAIAIGDVFRIERRFGSGGGWKSGAVFGGAIATVVSAYALVLSCEINCSPLPAVGIVGISALIGGIAGQLIRPPQHSWREEWPQKEVR